MRQEVPSETDIHLQVLVHRPSRTFLLCRSDRADAGFYLSLDEPICIPEQRKDEMAALLKRWSLVPMKVVRTPLRNEYPKVTEHRLVGEKTYKAFVRNCRSYTLSRVNGRMTIAHFSPEPNGHGFLAGNEVYLPPGIKFEEAFECLWADMMSEI